MSRFILPLPLRQLMLTRWRVYDLVDGFVGADDPQVSSLV
jgi:hypothetical protein